MPREIKKKRKYSIFLGFSILICWTIFAKKSGKLDALEYTYVRPTPTYTASFSTNELTLTASITSITNAHNSFVITLERSDGTVLQTHTLADGETSLLLTRWIVHTAPTTMLLK